VTLRRHLQRTLHRAIPACLAAAMTAATLAAAPAPARPVISQHAGATRAASGTPLTSEQASARARATGRPVTVSALTTPTSVTVARPDGRFALTESAVPVRARSDGRWKNLNPVLHHNANGTISPAVTSSALTLSGGGTGPLAVMTTDARTLSLSWPAGPLPSPSVSGATATYANVLPGVDLAVTASAQGGFSEVFIVKTAAAAANPALASLKLTASAPGLTVTADGSGNLQAAPGPQAVPVFTASAPLAWDSAPPPASMPTTTNQDGTLVNAQTGLPADSSATAPGSAAHSATVAVTVSGNTITLSPPASVLAASGTVYPVYIDPTWWPAGSSASAWTQVDQGYPTTSYWKESSYLQSGLCPVSLSPPGACGSGNGVEVARSFVRLPIPSQLTGASVINAAYLYTTENWAPSCTQKSVRLYTTGGISSSTTWNNQPSWSSSYLYQNAAFGYSSSCPASANDVTWTVTSTISNDVGSTTSQTWGIRAADETSELGWKQFYNGGGSNSKYYPHLTVYYNDPPNRPSGRTTNPGGSCQYSAGTAPVIGNDDVTFSADVSDDDGDNNLTTRFIILNSDGSTAYDSSVQGTSFKSGNNATAPLTLTRSVMQGLHSGGATTAYTYHWYAMTTDDNGLTNTMPSDECYFTYNPVGPSAPSVTVPSSGMLGQQVSATFSTTGCSSSSPCPASYTYQLGASTPVPVNIATSSSCTTTSTSASCTLNIPIQRYGPMLFTVYGTASNGNLSEASTQQLTGNPPATAYTDGDVNGDGHPDLLTLGGGNAPGLWLSPSNGTGTLSGATDIGGTGTGINPGADGPSDWAGAIVLHADFTLHKVQDVMAYYPSTGSAVILAGSGDGTALRPIAGTSSWLLSSGTFYDPLTFDQPTLLVAAGNASLTNSGTADLIGIAGDTANGYELDLFTDTTNGGPTGYGYTQPQVLSAQSPDGATPSDWNNFALATAQPGGNPSNTELFALNTATGALYESTNPSQSTSSIIGTGNWQQITSPWGSSPPTLLSGDINSSGQAELWTRSGTTITAYALSGTTLTAEHSAAVSQPLNDWPLADGQGTTATDTIAGQNATLTGGATWITGDISQFGNLINLDGTGYLTPPASTIPTGTSPPKISIWFKTTNPGGVLVSVQKNPLSSGPALPSQFDPVLYIGTDGKLYGEWWNGSVDPAISNTIVDDGIWHHAVLTGGNTQTLYLDGASQQTVSGSTSFQFTPTNLTLGAGYIGGSWPSEPNYQNSNSSDYRYYLNGQIAAITYSYPGGP